MNKLETYTLPRPFFNYNIPIAIQSSYLKDYANKKNLQFSLPITEIVKKECYYMFEKKFQNRVFQIGMTSIFMLPLKNEKLFKQIFRNINSNTIFHFVLENLVLKKNDIIKWRVEYISFSKLSKDYSFFIK